MNKHYPSFIKGLLLSFGVASTQWLQFHHDVRLDFTGKDDYRRFHIHLFADYLHSVIAPRMCSSCRPLLTLAEFRQERHRLCWM